MNRSSIYRNIIDFKKSKGSYLFDKRNGNKLLDFFGQYATLTLGYNHSIFKTSIYLNEIANVAHQKIPNCELFSDESTEFDISFRNFTCGSNFTNTFVGRLVIVGIIHSYPNGIRVVYHSKWYSGLSTFRRRRFYVEGRRCPVGPIHGSVPAGSGSVASRILVHPVISMRVLSRWDNPYIPASFHMTLGILISVGGSGRHGGFTGPAGFRGGTLC